MDFYFSICIYEYGILGTIEVLRRSFHRHHRRPSCPIISVCRAAEPQFHPSISVCRAAEPQFHPSSFTPAVLPRACAVSPQQFEPVLSAHSQFQYRSFTRAYCSVLKRSNGYCYQLFLLISLQSHSFTPAVSRTCAVSPQQFYPCTRSCKIVFVTNYFCLLVVVVFFVLFFCCCSQAFRFLY